MFLNFKKISKIKKLGDKSWYIQLTNIVQKHIFYLYSVVTYLLQHNGKLFKQSFCPHICSGQRRHCFIAAAYDFNDKVSRKSFLKLQNRSKITCLKVKQLNYNKK